MTDRRAGALWGLAYGDAWGFPVEFHPWTRITKAHGFRGPEFPKQAVVSDDTQMALATWDAIADQGVGDLEDLGVVLADHFLSWMVDADNDRAPGNTCMGSLYALADADDLGSWPRLAIRSKGCGAAMRAPWVGVHPAVPTSSVSAVAQLQASITHAHPTALAAADLTACLTRALAADEVAPGDTLRWALELVAARLKSDPGPIAPLMAASSTYRTGRTYSRAGWTELRRALERAQRCQAHSAQLRWRTDPCRQAGEGWVADEAVACALLILDVYVLDGPLDTLRRAVTTGGDSDTLACLVGAFLGAANGPQVFPQHWAARMEPRYRQALERRAEGLHGRVFDDDWATVPTRKHWADDVELI